MAAASSIKDIVVLVDLGGERRPVTVAADLARRTGAEVTGIAMAFNPLVPMYTSAAPVPADFIVQAQKQSLAEAKAAGDAFQAIAGKAGVKATTRIAQSITGDGFADVVSGSLLADLAVVGQDDPDQPEPMREALIEAFLFQSGLPTLLVPHSGVAAFAPDKAVIAWKASATAARAVRAALPLLAMARSISIVTVDEGREAAVPGAELAVYLKRRDLDATVRNISGSASGAGREILEFCSEAGADVLVMGAYGHSRLREFLLGGVTRHILTNATLPVLMTH
jgi:nucleotide-binding universal stress UspA family protein